MGHGNGGLDAMHRAQQRMKARKLKQKQKEQALLEAQRRATMQAIFEETAAKNSGYQDKSTVNTDEFISSEQGKNNEGNPTEVRPEDGVVYFYCPDIKKVKPKGFWGKVKKFFGAEEKKVQYIINYNPPTIQYPEESKADTSYTPVPSNSEEIPNKKQWGEEEVFDIEIKPEDLPKPLDIEIGPEDIPEPLDIEILPEDIPKPLDIEIDPEELKPLDIDLD